MVDAYLPALSDFKFSADEEAAIAAAMLEESPWDKVPAAHKDAMKGAKQRILSYHMARHKQQCCYCRAILQGGGYFMIDREHILPKSLYKPFTFAPWNLSVSCKRCNMQFKKDCVAFVIDAQGAGPADTGEAGGREPRQAGGKGLLYGPSRGGRRGPDIRLGNGAADCGSFEGAGA